MLKEGTVVRIKNAERANSRKNYATSSIVEVRRSTVDYWYYHYFLIGSDLGMARLIDS